MAGKMKIESMLRRQLYVLYFLIFLQKMQIFFHKIGSRRSFRSVDKNSYDAKLKDSPKMIDLSGFMGSRTTYLLSDSG